MPEILSIEREDSEHFWKEKDFVRFLRSNSCLGRIVMIGDKVVGYAIYRRYAKRLHLFNLVVASACRRKGIGTQLISSLLAANFCDDECVTITLNIKSSNLGGQLFCKAMEFEAANVLRGFYGDEDAYRFVYFRDPVVYLQSVGV